MLGESPGATGRDARGDAVYPEEQPVTEIASCTWLVQDGQSFRWVICAMPLPEEVAEHFGGQGHGEYQLVTLHSPVQSSHAFYAATLRTPEDLVTTYVAEKLLARAGPQERARMLQSDAPAREFLADLTRRVLNARFQGR